MSNHTTDTVIGALTGEQLLLQRILGTPAMAAKVNAELDRRSILGRDDGRSGPLDTIASLQSGPKARKVNLNAAA